jgi:hypothetical protein
MQDPTKIDYSKLLGFDMVAKDVTDGVDFQDATVGAKLGAKIGKTISYTTLQRMMLSTDLPSETVRAGGAIMRGLGGRTVSET